jgi:hypothetical protein
MKTALILCLLCPISLTAQSDAKKTTDPAPRTEVKIPAGAVKGEDGIYRFTDSKGKKWIYRETPFGIAKSEDKPKDPTATPFGKVKAPASDPASSDSTAAPAGKDPTVAYDEGDTVRFERPTPFGTSTWRKKKTDLTDAERKILDQQKSKQK